MCVKVKSGKIVVLLKIILNQSTSDCFVNLSRIFTIFSIHINNDTVHMLYNFGCHGNHFGRNLCYHSCQIIILLNGLAQF